MEQHASSPPVALANATLIGQMFIDRYYKVLALMPQALARFYSEQSTTSIDILHATGTTQSETAAGLASIAEKVMSTIQGAVATTDHIDAQHSAGGGLLLQVTGSMKMQALLYKFTQSFFLAPQEKGYFVLNDILRVTAAEAAPYAAVGFPAHETENAVQHSAPQVPDAVPAQQQHVPEPAHTYSAPVQQEQQQQPLLAAQPPAAPARAAAPEPTPEPAVRDVEVPQPAKQLTPPRPVAPPAPVNMTYAQRLKFSSAGLVGSPPPAAAAPAAPAAVETLAEAPAAETNGHARAAPPAKRPEPVAGVFVKGLPQDVTTEQLEAEFSKLGAVAAVSIQLAKFGNVNTAQVRFENTATMDAALKAEVVVGGKKLALTRLRADLGPAPRGASSGGRGSGPVRYGSGSRGRGSGGRGERSERPDDRPPRDRPEGPRERVRPDGPRERAGDAEERKDRRPPPGTGDKRAGSNNSRRGNSRSGSAPRSNPGNDAAPAAAAQAAKQ